ncbi:MAG: hypothetical protein ABJF89_04015 [Parasphingorhabdus sp.]|uniref:hypothetical protein n=1 Tax=Parasphingorhabdus sp. TaxID=2709688 RepID=UPI00326566D1
MSILIDKNTKVITQGMRGIVFGTIATLIAFSSPALAEAEEESPNLVPAFAKTCLMPGVAHSDRIAALAADETWETQESVSYDLIGLQPSRAIGSKPKFKHYTDAAQWDGEIDGRKASFLLLTFREKSRFRHACVLLVEGLRNAMPYGSDLKTAFKAFGAGGKSVDLVHYYEFAGTLKPGKHPVEAKQKVHGEIFSRSQAGTMKETTHIYVAY